MKNDKYKFLGMYGETPDTTGGFGMAGVEAFQKFFEAGGTLIAAEGSVTFLIEFGFAHSAGHRKRAGRQRAKAARPG